jgi:hypothetical protein
MTFTPFQDSLQKTAARHGLAREFRAIKICRAFDALLPELFPDQKEAATQALRAQSYKQNTLVISVPSSTWANEIMIRKHKILEEINTRLPQQAGKPLLKDIKTRISP